MRKLIISIISSVLLVGSFCSCSNTKDVKVQTDTASEGEAINLYFADSEFQYVVAEKRIIKNLTPQKAVQALIDGPKNKDLVNALPKEVEVSNVSIENGIAHVYMHESIPISEHGNYGSSAITSHIINSICGTLILHEPFGIKKVKLEGDIGDILYGVILDEPMEVNLQMFKLDK